MRQEKRISTEDDLTLYIETYGTSSDEACLFISGAGANSSFWSEGLCERLVDNGFFVVKYDHRDFGLSTKIDWEDTPYDFRQLKEDALSILEALGIDRAHVIGHSMGGFIVQLLGIHHPERLLSMTSISASTSSPTMPPLPERTWEIFLANQPTGDFDKDLAGFLTVWEYLNGTAEFDQDLAIEYTRNLYARQTIDGALGASHVKAQATLTDRTEALKKVRIPTLVLHGAEDYAVDPYGGKQTAEAIPNAELIVIPRMGHMPFNQEIRDRFEQEVIRFITENRQRVYSTFEM